MTPIEVFPSIIVSSNNISIDKLDLHLPIEFDGATLAYSFIEKFIQTQSLPIVKDNPVGIGVDQYRQRYRLVLTLKLDKVELLPENNTPIPIPPTGGQQLTNELRLTNNLQLRN